MRGGWIRSYKTMMSSSSSPQRRRGAEDKRSTRERHAAPASPLHEEDENIYIIEFGEQSHAAQAGERNQNLAPASGYLSEGFKEAISHIALFVFCLFYAYVTLMLMVVFVESSHWDGWLAPG